MALPAPTAGRTTGVPPTPRPELGAVVLAGGRSTRFGGDKLEAPVGGARLLDAALGTAVRVASTVVAVGPADRSLPSDVLVVREEPAYAGPFAAVVAGVGALPDSCPLVLVLAGDLLDPGRAVDALLVAYREPYDAVVVLDAHGTRQPLLAVYSARALRARFARDAAEGIPAAGRPARALLDGLAVLEVPGRADDGDSRDDLPG